jgi:hypothetical protein
MKLHHERNSFVCIATEDPAFHQVPRTATSQRRAHTACPADCQTHGKCLSGRRLQGFQEPPNGLRLTGLLRQIQAFQRQLVMA